jgi:hypothetical protein
MISALRVSLGGISASLLVKARDVFQTGFLRNGIHQVHAAATRKKKDVVGAGFCHKRGDVIGKFHNDLAVGSR